MDDVFGILSDAVSGDDTAVILKSKARKLCVERDGMSEEEFEEHWEYNIAGSKGKGSYSVVDDTLSIEEVNEWLE